MKAETHVINFDDLSAKRRHMSSVGKLRGLYEVTYKPRKLTRSLNANSYYHVAVCAPWAEYLREQYGDPSITHLQAHEVLKIRVLGMDVKTDKEGNQIEVIPETKNMDVTEFSLFIDAAAKFLAEFAGIVVLDSNLFWESKQESRKLRKVG